MDRSHLTAGWNNNLRRLWGHDSVLFSDGDLHKRQTRFVDLLHKVFVSEIEKWQQREEPTEVHSELTEAISGVIFTYMWGPDCPQMVSDKLLDAFGTYSAAVQGIIPVVHAMFCYGKGMEAKRAIDGIVSAEVDRRELDRETSGIRTDAMLALINAHWEGEITRAELVANCRALVFSSVDTTAAALTIAVHFVLKHPKILAKVKEESTRVLGECAWQTPVGSGRVTPAKLKELVYTEATKREALRIQVPATLSTRLVKKDMPITVDGKTFVLPEGANVYNTLY
ncbi:hypothetical protein SARC_06742 [Sphaeroforma arctica JP610]|uniref:Cytochrome P450 n=1 Tax=Sphaeroforma arctica JP610 TaxID=667725 RepID=A0A0L0FWF5_9EUKA|nr:hypothetical protein SARC_06742 [Sphaeroforma arctica JP610]KNC80901.1 hypothetical protein SARC_06742 [Sphaeroforma arctica JP610]|eukprot:XP_014154803.1 hypothetical protein SARC_06742 [Sphaeroforma arctica JP610]